MNQLTQRNEFTNELAMPDTAATAVAAQAKALVEARYIIAMRRPRDMDVVRDRMLKECSRPSFAAVARYTKPIGKDKAKWPTGPSIRFAEAAVRHMTNITVEVMTVYDDREKRLVRVTVTDLEANLPYSQDVTIAKTIERRQTKQGDTVISTRTNSYGDTLYILEATDDDITNKQQALISKAIRTLGLRLIPGDIIDECMDQILVTQANADAEDPDAAKRKLFDAFSALGVRADQLKEYLGHEASTLTPAEMTTLRGLYASIRDGEASWRDVMEERSATEEELATLRARNADRGASKGSKDAGAVKDAIDKAGGPKKTAAPAPPPPDEPNVRPYAFFADAIVKATAEETAALVLDEARDELSPKLHAELCDLFRDKWSKTK